MHPVISGTRHANNSQTFLIARHVRALSADVPPPVVHGKRSDSYALTHSLLIFSSLRMRSTGLLTCKIERDQKTNDVRAQGEFGLGGENLTCVLSSVDSRGRYLASAWPGAI